VVGLVEFPSQLEQTLLFAPMTEESPKGFELPDNSWLVDTPGPVSWAQVMELNQSGIVVTSRDVLAHPPSTNALPAYVRDQLGTRELAIGTLVAGLSLLEIVLLAGPAFAVSARRRQRQSLWSPPTRPPAHVRRITG
jgi:putative ABC transport system permease protein